MASHSPNNAVDLIRQALADLETRRSRLASELAELEGEVKKHRTALSALTGEATPGRAVTKVQVREELVALLREAPGGSLRHSELEEELKRALKHRGYKLTNWSRRLQECFAEEESVVAIDGDVVSLAAEGGQRAAS